MKLQIFNQIAFLPAIKALFNELKVPINFVADEPTSAKEILKDTFKENETFHLINDVYFVGMVDDAAFKGSSSLAVSDIKSDYDGILIFGVTLKDRPNSLLPTRAQLAEIARAFNREFYYTPVVIVFKYSKHIAFANTERLKYKQEWREGEKAGKVSLLRDINIETPHSGHERILLELKIPVSGKNQVDSYAKLYAYWQEVFSVSILNKKFYQELSTWYFWATKHVIFPGEPTIADAHRKNARIEDLLQEHKATNVIRMLTRLLFVWFIKEKKLIPEELFELKTLQEDILNEISPYHDETSMFKGVNKDSVYYKAILQNLFFATLNCPIQGDNLDTRKRGFRGEGYGTHRGIDYLLRYKQYFKNPEKFLEKLNETVPFLNGGLFECLDEKFNNTYIDGFSDQMTKGEKLIVPDYLFFGVSEEADISDVVGIDDKKYKNAAVKGLINILKSYKFTIVENTPIEEDVALDPELLGKVFENLLASYNPETKTTARKQTGSFYTPREIVNYMVDESLIAYLKNAITNWGLNEEALDTELHVLTSFDTKVPFNENNALQKEIIQALSTCTILDPACGSGAFPMGILQKMVHILQKLDPNNKVWKEVQLAKAEQESKTAFEIEDKQARQDQLLEINEAFDQSINDPDYARKLFLIENCIYGVDIQPIAIQISKLRFFISLVVEQKVNSEKINFGIRPLPNLETKFVAANTLIGIEKPKIGDQLNMYSTDGLKKLETELKKVRSKLFSAKSKDTKIKYRQRDEELRNQIAEELEKSGWKGDTAQKLANWDPYNQNASSPFFDPEWMFDIKEGFDVLIGNPPYINISNLKPDEYRLELRNKFRSAKNKSDTYAFFLEQGFNLLKSKGTLSYIIPQTWKATDSFSKLREIIFKDKSISKIVDLEFGTFDAIVKPMVVVISNAFGKYSSIEVFNDSFEKTSEIKISEVLKDSNLSINTTLNKEQKRVFQVIEKDSVPLENIIQFSRGIKTSDDSRFIHTSAKNKDYKKVFRGKNIKGFEMNWNGEYVWYRPDLMKEKVGSVSYTKEFFEVPEKLVTQRVNSSMQLLCAYDDNRNYFLDTTNVSRYETWDKKTSLKYLCAILNSKVINYWYCNKYLMPTIGIYEMHTIPIKKAKDQKPFITIVDKILKAKEENAKTDTSKLEKQLDEMVYKLYELTVEEINVIENKK
jgi:tRNA1(Val) A37 N6-methylase TrmN6